MIRLAISVEGPTEVEFVKTVLVPYLRISRVEVTPISLNGNVTVQRLASDMARLVWSFDRVTSLVDYYGFRDKQEMTPDALEQRIGELVDKEINRSWNQSSIVPYVQVHEFEGLLFSDVAAFVDVTLVSESHVEQLREVRSQFPTPEDIDDGKETAPSKRILQVIPRYQKVVDGPLIAATTGLGRIRAECPRFHDWLTQLEVLGN